MPPGEPLRAGIIGAGWVARDRHLPAYRKIDGVEIAAIQDRQPERAASLAKAAGGSAQATDSLSELLDLCPDVVSICTPPFAHREPALAALERGVAVFMEKPMAMSHPEALEIAEAAKASGTLLTISHNFLFSRSMQRVKRAMAAGKAGRVISVLGVQASSPRRRLPDWYGQLPCGLFFDESPHLLYLMRSVLGDFELAGAVASKAAAGARQPVSAIQAVFRSGDATAALSMSFEAPVSEWFLVITCERRVFALDLFRDISVVLAPDGEHRALDILRTSVSAGFQHGLGIASTGGRLLGKRQSWGHEELIRRVVKAVRAGGPSPVPVEDSLHVAKVMDDIVAAVS